MKEMAGWVTLRSLAKDRGIHRQRLLRHLKALDARSPGRFLRRSAAKTTGRLAPWLVNVRMLDLEAGPSREKIDGALRKGELTIADLRSEVRRLARRLSALEARVPTVPDGVRPPIPVGRPA